MFDVVITNTQPLAQGICGLTLKSVDGSCLPAFEAGAHIDIHLPSGLVRQYSLIDPSRDDQYQIGVLLDPQSRGGSAEVHGLEVGQQLSISEPRNLFALDADASHALLFAGGIGITPIVAMASSLGADGKSFELHYSARSRKSAAFADQLSSLADCFCYFNDEDNALDAMRVLTRATAGSHLYVCGPAGYIEHIFETARQLGWAEERLHREFFAAPEVVSEDGDRAFELVIASTGQVLEVGEQDSALEVLEDAGFDIPSSCEQGVCGSCVTRLTDGIPDHRDSFLTTTEQASNQLFTPCCSRAKGNRLVLDL